MNKCVDTNVWIRLIMQDDNEQYKVARKFIENQYNLINPILITDISLCEIVWVLRSGYKLDRKAIVHELWMLFETTIVTFQDRLAVFNAIVAFENYKGDFSDYLIKENANAYGCNHVVTFDKALLKEDGFVHP